MKDQLIALLQNEQIPKWVAFLQSLDGAQKKELASVIKALLKENTGVVQTGPNTWSSKGNYAQSHMLQVAAFVCMSKSDYEKTPYPTWLITRENLDPVLSWHCPDWLSDFVNQLASERELPSNVNYSLLIEFMQKGYLRPTPALLAKALHGVIYERKGREVFFRPEVLLQYPITLQEHIWYLFQYESNIHLFERYIYEAQGIELHQPGWLETFRRFVKSGHIDRTRLLKAALLASNNNFNKLASGWFADLFIQLSPSQEEILIFQPALLSVLHASHTKPVNTALDYLKKIIEHKDFNVTAFLEQAPALISSEAKNLVASVLQVLEKLAKLYPEMRPLIATIAAQAFIHSDESVQIRAAKLVTSLKQVPDESIVAVLAPYHGTMKLAAKKILPPLPETPATISKENAPTPTTLPPTAQDTALPVVKSIDDLIFLASQAFDNNQSWHIDLLPAALLQWHSVLQGPDANKLEPALQRPLKTTSTYEFRSGQGYLDHMLATFFIDVCAHLVNTCPGQVESLQKVLSRTGIDSNSSQYLTQWGGTDRDNYQPHKQLLQAALRQFQSSTPLPLLSTPTHAPAWIDAEILVQRLAAYQHAKQVPDNMDLQIALSRCRLPASAAAIEKLKANLNGEYLHLVLFLLGEEQEPRGPFTLAEAWIAASLALPEKNEHATLSGLHIYNNTFAYYTGRYDWHFIKVGLLINRAFVPKFPAFNEREHLAHKKLLYFYTVSPGYSPVYLPADAARLLLLAPNNPGPQLARLLSDHLVDSNFYEVNDRELITRVIQAL